MECDICHKNKFKGPHGVKVHKHRMHRMEPVHKAKRMPPRQATPKRRVCSKCGAPVSLRFDPAAVKKAG